MASERRGTRLEREKRARAARAEYEHGRVSRTRANRYADGEAPGTETDRERGGQRSAPRAGAVRRSGRRNAAGQASHHRRRRHRRVRIQGVLMLLLMTAAVVLIFLGLVHLVKRHGNGAEGQETRTESRAEETGANDPAEASGPDDPGGESGTGTEGPVETEAPPPESAEAAAPDTMHFFAGYQPDTSSIAEITNPEVNSPYAVLVDLDHGTVVAGKNPQTVMYPASMTKILTALVAAEHVQSLSDTFTITPEISDFVYRHDCSTAGFQPGDAVTVYDLFRGTILPSGAEAAMALAEYSAGSQEAFVELMNRKVQELGLAGTAHFTNCIGLFDEENHCTVLDMAMILKAAVENPISLEALSEHRYQTGPTQNHPEGLDLSNWFLRRIEDKDNHGTVIAAKTGYVVQSGNCAASFIRANDGTRYVCVTGGAHSAWRCIYDHVAIFQGFIQ